MVRLKADPTTVNGRDYAMLDEQDDRFYVGPSRIPGAGDGLFSRVPLRAGDRLAVIGVTIRTDSHADRCTRYADQHKYRVGDTLVIPVGFGAMVNHSTSPNMAKVVDARRAVPGSGARYRRGRGAVVRLRPARPRPIRTVARMTQIAFTPGGGATMEILDSDRTSSFSNTGAAGINRLVPLDDLLLVDNIGRNFELRQVSDAAGPAWIQRALYDVTLFPGEDNPSILDSDVHGAFLTADRRWLLVGNHFGRVRCFAWPLTGHGSPCRPSPSVELQLPGDTERLAFDGTRLITSSPRGSYTPDPPRPGVFISESVTPLLTASPDGRAETTGVPV